MRGINAHTEMIADRNHRAGSGSALASPSHCLDHKPSDDVLRMRMKPSGPRLKFAVVTIGFADCKLLTYYCNVTLNDLASRQSIFSKL